MDNFITKRIEKGTALMESAIEKYRNGDFAGAEQERKEANRLLNETEKKVKTTDGKLSMLYGDHRNFGVMYKVFEQNAKKLYESKKNTEDIGSMLRYIKENKVLKAQFDIYNNLVHPINVVNEEKFVESVVTLAKRYPKSVLKENNDKFIKLMKLCGLNEMIDIPSDEMELYEAVEYVTVNEPNMTNINKYNEVKTFLAESVKERNKNMENVDIDKIYESKINELSEKYDGLLNEDEKKFIEKLSHPSVNKEAMFEEVKSEAAIAIRKQLAEDEGNTEHWNEILEQIESKSYSHENAIVDIAEMINVKNTLDS